MNTIQNTMRISDLMAFRDAARNFKCWILVRAINPASVGYLGDLRYTSKPIDCKPKTADVDVGVKRLAGLVIVPAIHGAQAFRGGKWSEAQSSWGSFRETHELPIRSLGGGTPRDQGIREAQSLNSTQSEYRVDLDERSPHFGVLQFRGMWIHGDCDLKDIILQGQERRNLAAVETLRGQPHMRGPLYFAIRTFINARLGKEMIQHGGDAQYREHEEGVIDVFGPEGERDQLANRVETVAWYQRNQRRIIDMKLDRSNKEVAGKTPEELRRGFQLIQGGRGS